MGKAVLAMLGRLLTFLAACGTIVAQETKPAGPAKGDTRPGGANDKDPAGVAVARLVDHLRRHPARPSMAPDRLALHLIDVETGEVTLIADQPDAGLVRMGSPSWSLDGHRIIFDAMPMNRVAEAHLKVIQLQHDRVTLDDLGPGNCPTFSPDDSRIAFLLNVVPERGVWLMEADGSNRRILGSYGRPLWSPDSRQFMIVNFNVPRLITMMDVEPEKNGVVRIADKAIYPEPCWVGEGTIVAAIGSEGADAIALVDVRQPRHATIQEVLWQRADGPDVKPYYPLYSPRTRRCVFVGIEPKGMALYTFRRGQHDRPRRLEPEGFDKLIQDVAMSPDGRYVLFCSTRPPRR
jgi:hypothetical protein